jgi:hypothetical protein
MNKKMRILMLATVLLLLFTFALMPLGAARQVVPTAEACIDCETVLSDCANAAQQYYQACLLTGDSPRNCQRQRMWFLKTCVGVDCEHCVDWLHGVFVPCPPQ